MSRVRRRFFVGVCALALLSNVSFGAKWSVERIGAGTKGDAKFEGDEIHITAVTGDIWNNADTAMFVYKEAVGDLEISARFKEYKPANPDWGKAGLMIRQSIDADAPNAFINLTENNGLKLIHRDTKGGDTGPGDPGAPYSLPIFLKLTRVGDLITAYTSEDGENWAEAGGGLGPSAEIPMKPTVVAGIAMSSNSPGEAFLVVDTVDGTGDFARAVDPTGKLATTWATVKRNAFQP